MTHQNQESALNDTLWKIREGKFNPLTTRIFFYAWKLHLKIIFS